MSAARVQLATGPVSWGVDFADAPGNPDWRLVLDEIAASGFRATELGPVGYLPEDEPSLRRALDERGLVVNGSFLFQPLHDPRRREQVLAVARRTCAAIAAAGGRFLVVLDLVDPERPRPPAVATSPRACRKRAGRGCSTGSVPSRSWRGATTGCGRSSIRTRAATSSSRTRSSACCATATSTSASTAVTPRSPASIH